MFFRKSKKTEKSEKSQKSRTFSASIRDRINNFDINPVSMDSSIKSGLSALRKQSRDLDKNNDYLKRFHTLLETHVVGNNGIKLQALFRDGKGELETKVNTMLEQNFNAWAREADVAGKNHWVDIQRLVVRTVARDGEAFIRMVKGTNHNKWRFSLQLLDSELVDEQYNDGPFEDGSRIKMGIKIDEWGKPLSYFFRTDLVEDGRKVINYQGKNFIEIPAGDIIHVFLPVSMQQTRGIPWSHTVIRRLNILGHYEESELVAARTAACKMGFFKRKDYGETQYTGEQLDEQGNYVQDAQPGSFEYLAPGVEFQSLNWEHDGSNYSAFVKQILRGISSGLNVSYNSLNSDLENVNFSSLRSGLLEEREFYKDIQAFVIRNFVSKVFKSWLETSAALSKEVNISVRKVEKYLYPSFAGRRWQWIDPLKEVKASVIAVNNKLKSRSEIAAEQGRSVEDVFAELKNEEDQIEALGLSEDKFEEDLNEHDPAE